MQQLSTKSGSGCMCEYYSTFMPESEMERSSEMRGDKKFRRLRMARTVTGVAAWICMVSFSVGTFQPADERTRSLQKQEGSGNDVLDCWPSKYLNREDIS